MSGIDCFTFQSRVGHVATIDRASPARPATLHPHRNDADLMHLILCRPPVSRRIGYIVAADAGPFAIEGLAGHHRALTVRLEFDTNPNLVELIDALSHHHRISHAGDRETARPSNALCLRRRPPAGDQSFHLEPITTDKLPYATSALIEDIADAITLPLRWDSLLNRLRAGALRPGLAEPLLRLLSTQEQTALAAHLMATPADLALLQSAMPTNAWLGERFENLAAWLNAANAPAEHSPARATAWLKTLLPFRRALPAAVAKQLPGPPVLDANNTADLPGSAGALAHRPDLGLHLVAQARAQARPGRAACIVACARNEGPYLLDWIAYHRGIGFDHIFLYTNDNSDGSDELLGLLARAGEITWFRNHVTPGTLPQFRAYAHALSVLPEILDYRWALVCDLDEYFGYDTARFSSARDYLEWQDMRRADAVALPWLLHVARANDGWHDADVVTRLKLREQTVNHHIKSVFRTQSMWSANPHHPDAIPGKAMHFLAETGLPHVPLAPAHSPSLSHNPVASHAWIAHYIFRTAPEALQKILRGRGDTDNLGRDTQAAWQMMKTFIKLTTATPLIQDLRTAKCAAPMPGERARLRRIPGVAAAEAGIKDAFVKEMHRASDVFLGEPVDIAEPAECREFRRLLQQCLSHRAAA
jgi:hypothetical protein